MAIQIPNYMPNRSDHQSSNSISERVARLKFSLDPEYILNHLGFSITKKTSKELRCACKIHGGSNASSFRVNLESKTWYCYSSRCHETYGNDFIALYRAVNSCSFMTALEELERLVGTTNISSAQFITFKQKQEQNAFVAQSNTETFIPSYVTEAKLKLFKPLRSNLFVGDGFTKETLDEFEVAGGFVDEDSIIRDIIPIRNDKGVLVAYSLRDTRKNVVYERKYKLTPGFNKDHVLYNLHRCKDILKSRPVIVVEGFKSVWKLHSLGITNVVACMGSALTPGQASLLFTYANKVVLFLDNDMAGAIGLGSSFRLLKNKIDVVAEWITEVDPITNKGLDPAELTDERLMYYVGGYK